MYFAQRIFLLVFSIAFVEAVCGQNQKDTTSFEMQHLKKEGWFNYIQVTGYNGQVMGDSEKKKLFEEDFWGGGIRLGKQSSGRKSWQQIHGYPQYGIGISYFNLGNDQVDSMIGKPLSFYCFYGAPIACSQKFRLNADLEIGLSTAFHAYDPQTNPDQTIIGATTNLHACLSLETYYKVSQRMDLALGLSFMHFSNGKIYTPQQGINLFGLNLSTVYHYDSKHKQRPNGQKMLRPEFIKYDSSTFEPFGEWSIMASLGTVQSDPGNWKHSNGDRDTTTNVGPRYLTNSISMDYTYQRWRKWKLAAGVDFFYDRSLEHLYADKKPSETKFTDKAFYGAHIGLHYNVAKISAIFNYGRYVYKPFYERGKWYMRIGGRFEVAPMMDLQLTLKTRNGRIADWIEWGIAYKFRTD